MTNKARKLNSSIGIMTPGGPLSKDRTDTAYSTIKSLNYSYFAPIEPYKYYADYTNEFTNGSSIERLQAINYLIDSKDSDVLLAARGVTGSLEIISNFPFDKLALGRKLLIGQSDCTSLLVQTPFRSKIPSIHGPTLGAEFADYFTSEDAKESVDTLISLISDPEFRLNLKGSILKNGHSKEGMLIAGNLSTLIHLLGTKFDIDYSNCILVLEDVGEPPYKIKRMLNHLLLCGKFDKLRGLCFGRFSKCISKHGPDVASVISRFIKENLARFDFPVLLDLPIGHWGKNMPLPIGCNALIKNDLLCILESPIG